MNLTLCSRSTGAGMRDGSVSLATFQVTNSLHPLYTIPGNLFAMYTLPRSLAISYISYTQNPVSNCPAMFKLLGSCFLPKKRLAELVRPTWSMSDGSAPRTHRRVWSYDANLRYKYKRTPELRSGYDVYDTTYEVRIYQHHIRSIHTKSRTPRDTADLWQHKRKDGT